jgi:hypothetical protein
MYYTEKYHDIEDEIRSCLYSALARSDTNSFDSLYSVFLSHFERPCNSMLELKKRTKKSKGTAFEVFCLMYLRAKGYERVWLLAEAPSDVLELLGLDRFDCGIDIIAITQSKQGKELYFPIQCKFRKKNAFSHKVGWSEVSTFLSLCGRTGIQHNNSQRYWTKHIIMTNADSVVWRGKKTNKDYTIAKKTFEGISRIFWAGMLSSKPVDKPEQTKPADKEDIRLKRQAWLDRKEILIRMQINT